MTRNRLVLVHAGEHVEKRNIIRKRMPDQFCLHPRQRCDLLAQRAHASSTTPAASRTLRHIAYSPSRMRQEFILFCSGIGNPMHSTASSAAATSPTKQF